MRVVPGVANANRLHLEPQGLRLGENIDDKLFFHPSELQPARLAIHSEPLLTVRRTSEGRGCGVRKLKQHRVWLTL